MGAVSDEWNAAAARLRELPRAVRSQSQDFGTLYRLALEHGPRRLAGAKIDPERAADLIADLLSAKLDQLVDARDPFPFFLTAVTNAGRDWLRRKGSHVAAEPKVEKAREEEDRSERSAELNRLLSRLTPLEREIFALEASGEDHTSIGAAVGKKRDAIAQIISRARKRLREQGLL